jgi:hypothetical protein
MRLQFRDEKRRAEEGNTLRRVVHTTGPLLSYLGFGVGVGGPVGLGVGGPVGLGVGGPVGLGGV